MTVLSSIGLALAAIGLPRAMISTIQVRAHQAPLERIRHATNILDVWQAGASERLARAVKVIVETPIESDFRADSKVLYLNVREFATHWHMSLFMQFCSEFSQAYAGSEHCGREQKAHFLLTATSTALAETRTLLDWCRERYEMHDEVYAAVGRWLESLARVPRVTRREALRDLWRDFTRRQ